MRQSARGAKLHVPRGSRVTAGKLLAGRNVRIGRNVKIAARHLELGADVTIEDGVTIEADRVQMAHGSRIERDACLRVTRMDVGYQSRVEARVQVGGMGAARAEVFRLGDISLLGADSRVFVRVLSVGDYVKLHNHALINGRDCCTIGHNSWIGQNCILNAEGRLVVGNGVCVATYTSIYTHAYYADRLEGGTTFSIRPVSIEDDVWLVGGYSIVAPGVTIGKKSMVLSHSSVREDIVENRCMAGNPLRDITRSKVPYRRTSMRDKLAYMATYVAEFRAKLCPNAQIDVLPAVRDDDIGRDRERIIVVAKNVVLRPLKKTTIIDLSRRTYTKRLTDLEIRFLSFLVSYRARFLPEGHERVLP